MNRPPRSSRDLTARSFVNQLMGKLQIPEVFFVIPSTTYNLQICKKNLCLKMRLKKFELFLGDLNFIGIQGVKLIFFTFTTGIKSEEI
jgi:hypothetical protein